MMKKSIVPNNNAHLEQRLQEGELHFRLIADTAPVLICDGRLLRMRIRDFGVGFDSSVRGNGLGLVTMQERVRMIDGVLRFNPVPEGTEVEVEVKLECVDSSDNLS